MSGNITDSSGAVLPNADVTLTSSTTGRITHVVSNAHGEYLLSDVRVGLYRLQVIAPGFRAFTIGRVTVDADQNVRIDAKMQVGEVQVSVVVDDAGGSTVDTRSATVGMLVDQKLIDDLPIDSNNIVALAGLLPGVVNVNSPTTFTNDSAGPTYNASGSRANQNLMLLDGSMWNNVFYNTGLNYPPSQALQEVSVLLSNYKAQYGRNAGSVYNVITRSGSNAYHGTLWQYLQNRSFDAADYISHVNPKLVQNQFGGSLGGPILKNRLFFFVSYQDLRVAQQVTAQDFLLTPNERGLEADGRTAHPCNQAGAFPGHTCASFAEDAEATYSTANPPNTTDPTFSKYVANPMKTDPAGAASAFQTAWTRAGNAGTSPCPDLLQGVIATYSSSYIPYAEIPSECFNPVAVLFAQRYIPMSAPYSGMGSLPYTTTFAPQPRNDQNLLLRGDLNRGGHSIDMRYYRESANDLTSNSVSGGQGIANYELDRNLATLNFANIGDTWVLGPNLLNVLRAGYKRYDYSVNPTDPTTLSDMGGNITLPAKPVLPEFVVFNRFIMGGSGSAYSRILNQTLEFDDNLSWTRGRHNFQVGATWIHLGYDSARDYPGAYQFSATYSFIAPADFLMGLVYEANEGNTTFLDSSAPNLYTYAQDDWRVTHRLTLNYGVRYEIPYVWRAPHGRSTAFIPGYHSTVYPAAPTNLAYIGDPGINPTIIPTTYRDAAPRLGFAYDLRGDGATVIRGGGGIFYDAINASVVGVGAPFHFLGNYLSPAGGLSDPLQGLNPVPPNFTPEQTPQFVAPYSVYYPDPNFVTPYTESANLGVQRRIRRHGFVEADYIAKMGRHQVINADLNPDIFDCSGVFFQLNPALYCTTHGAGQTAQSAQARVKYPGFNYGGGGVVDVMTEATSNYRGAQLIAGMRGGTLLSFQASYTYSKSESEEDNGQTTGTDLAAVWPTVNLRYNYGPSSFDTRHVLSLAWVLNFPDVPIGSPFDKAVLKVLRKWQYSGVYSARTGMPFDIGDVGEWAMTEEPGERAALVPGMNPKLPAGRPRTEKVDEYFNTAAFQPPPIGTLSPLKRDALYGPGYINTSMAIGRNFSLWREKTLLFRADAFNVFNTPNLSNPNSRYSQDAGNEFGHVLSTVGTNGAVQTNGRRIQLSLNLRY